MLVLRLEHGQLCGVSDNDSKQDGAKNTFLVIDAQLEACGTPFDQIKAGLGLERCDGSGTVTRDNIATV